MDKLGESIHLAFWAACGLSIDSALSKTVGQAPSAVRGLRSDLYWRLGSLSDVIVRNFLGSHLSRTEIRK